MNCSRAFYYSVLGSFSYTQTRLNRIEQFANRVSMAVDSASQDPSAHLSDPVNAYQLVNRFINGWAALHDDVYDENGQGLYVSKLILPHYNNTR